MPYPASLSTDETTFWVAYERMSVKEDLSKIPRKQFQPYLFKELQKPIMELVA